MQRNGEILFLFADDQVSDRNRGSRRRQLTKIKRRIRKMFTTKRENTITDMKVGKNIKSCRGFK